MAATSILFQSERAPCGRIVEGEHFQDQDDECLITDNFYYACGCRCIQHVYHDGSVVHKVLHHDGRVLEDEFIAEHHP
jgi:hypothetical protein